MNPALDWPTQPLLQAIAPRLPGLTLEVLPSIDSTNTELMRRARAGCLAPALLVADQQTAGRGRQGRSWANAPGDCLMYSLALVLAPADWAGLSLVAGLSVAEAINAVLAENARQTPTLLPRRVGVKWPNDIWLDDDRKMGGTLIETANLPVGATVQPVARAAGPVETPPRYIIIGTGINIRTPQTATPMPGNAPVGLCEVLPGCTAPALLQRILAVLLDDVLAFAAHGFAPFKERFARVDVMRGRTVRLHGGTVDGTEGVAEGVANNGALLVRTAKGVQTVHSGEVSVRPAGMAAPGDAAPLPPFNGPAR